MYWCDALQGVGMAVPDRIKLYRAQQLRSVGGNARRMAHNPAQRSMLDIYDALGVLVMDENRDFGDDPTLVKNMADMVRRDRNHPAVVLWNFCNEGGCNGDNAKASCRHFFSSDPHCTCRDANNISIHMCASGDAFRRAVEVIDGTRAIIANEEPPMNPFLQRNTDVQGFSHRSGWMFDDFHLNTSGKYIPGLGVPNNTKTVVASECCSCISGRYPGNNAGCLKGETNMSDGRSFVAGTFSWTLNDYYGEARGYGVVYPTYGVSSEYGSFDLAGYEKGGAWWYRAWWLDDHPVSDSDRSIPIATPPVCRIWGDRWDDELVKSSGKPENEANATAPETTIPVSVVSAAASVELLLDGVTVGTHLYSVLDNAAFKVMFRNGSNLTAVCKDINNETVGSHSLVAPGQPAAIRLSLDAPSPAKGTGSALVLDGHDTAILRAELVDQDGNFVGKNVSVNITFAVISGPGRVVASHNGDASCHTPNLAPWHFSYFGLARGIVQVSQDSATPEQHRRRLRQIDVDGGRRTTIDLGGSPQPAAIVVTASSPGLKPATIEIPVSTNVSQHSVRCDKLPRISAYSYLSTSL